MDVQPAFALAAAHLAELSEPITVRLQEYKALAVRVYREYPYHCLAYGLFLLRYLLPVALDLAYGLAYAVVAYPSVRAVFGLCILTALATLWHIRQRILQWFRGAKSLPQEDFPSLDIDVPEYFSQFQEDQAAEQAMADAFGGKEVGGSFIHIEKGHASKSSLKLKSESLSPKRGAVEGDGRTVSLIPQHRPLCPVLSNRPAEKKRIGTAPIASTPTLERTRDDDVLPQKGTRSLERWETADSVAGLSTDLFPEKESDICLVPEQTVESAIDLPLVTSIANGHALATQVLDPEEKVAGSWVTFDTAPIDTNSHSPGPHHEENTSTSTTSGPLGIDFDDSCVSYVHYKSPSPDSSCMGSEEVDALHQTPISRHSSPVSFDSEAKLGEHGKAHKADLVHSEADIESDYLDPDTDLGIHDQEEVCEATLPYKDTQRDQFLAEIQTVFDSGVADNSVTGTEPDRREVWLGSFAIWKGFRWRKCKVVLEDDFVAINLLPKKKNDARDRDRGARWVYPLRDLTTCSSAGLLCRSSRNRRIKLSCPRLPDVTLRPSDEIIEGDFLRLLEEAQICRAPSGYVTEEDK